MLESVGRYRIEDRIGEGAMAYVYRAFDPHISRPLAVKLLKSEFLTDRQYADRFLREAKAAGALSHPNIVTIYDVGEADGTPYIVMELLEGQTLDSLLKAGPLDAATALRITIQLADALAFAHAQRVVHRDIKPSNIIVAPDGRSVKLLDFGIARVGDMVFDSESVRTQIGQILGTPRYMSPEQALGGEIDGRSDLFSVGVVLYEMLSGVRAFAGGSAATLAIQIVQRDPEPLAKVAPTTPGGVQFIVSKLLAKQPERRFADGAQLADAMRKELAALEAAGLEAGARHTYLPIQFRLPILLAAITALLLVGAIWTVLSRQYQAMEQVALASGNAISGFVASNAALLAVENATLPAAQQDWAPVEAFVRSAGDDPAIRRILVVGADGVVRAATDGKLLGKPYVAPTSRETVERRPGLTVTVEDAGDGPGTFRFVRPITYAGRSFGQVDVEVSKASLEEAGQLAQWLMIALGLTVLGGVALTSYLGARTLALPIRRLKSALLEVARGNLDFRISHNRRDEFGDLFDGFNLAAGAVQDRIASIESIALDTPSAVEELGSGPVPHATADTAASVDADPDRASASDGPAGVVWVPGVAAPVLLGESEALPAGPQQRATASTTASFSPEAPPTVADIADLPPTPAPAETQPRERSEPAAEAAPAPTPDPIPPVMPEPEPEATADPDDLDHTQMYDSTPQVIPQVPTPGFQSDDDDDQDTLIGPAVRR